MFSKFIFCLSLKTGYNLVGLLYLTVSIFASIYLYMSLAKAYNGTLIRVYHLGNVIVFGLPAFYWTLDQFSPKYKYKRMFYLLFMWLTLTWAILLTLFFLVLLILLLSESEDFLFFSTRDTIGLFSILLLAFGAVAIPTVYISKRMKAYIESTQTS